MLDGLHRLVNVLRAFRQQVDHATREGGELLCVQCGKNPHGFRTRREASIYHMLGLCQDCQDQKEP